MILTFFSCNTGEKIPGTFPISEGGDDHWIVYEGRVPLDEKKNLYMEVSMLPSDLTGEGYFQLSESLEKDHTYTPVSEFRGKYATIYGEGPEELIVHLHNSAQAEGLKRTYLSNTGYKTYFSDADIQVIKEEFFRKTDLTLLSPGKNKLIVLDQNLKPLTLDPQYNLTKRTSKLFTVEGYFRHKGDTADFFEMNKYTGEMARFKTWRIPPGNITNS